MTRRLSWALVVLVLWGSASLALAAPPARVLGERQQLPNGLVWLFSRQSELPLVTLQLLIKAGTLAEPQGKEGLANLTASLLRHQEPECHPDRHRTGLPGSSPRGRGGR